MLTLTCAAGTLAVLAVALALVARRARGCKRAEAMAIGFESARTPTEVAEVMIAQARVSGDLRLRRHVLGLLHDMHERDVLDGAEYLRLSASVAEWIVEGA